MKQSSMFFNRCQTLQAFSALIDYPESKEGLADQLEVLCNDSVSNDKDRIELLKKWLDSQSLGSLQEAYTGIFDINSLCSPYIGYHLFGEDYKRSLLLTGLKEKFRLFGFDRPYDEMPDHLSVVLRFLSTLTDEGFYDELINEALKPSIGKMLSEINPDEMDNGKSSNEMSARNFYASILAALKNFIKLEAANDQ
ncbi:MAG: hypothetical protein GXP60_06525 [Epsilonproteobacteria bacterium]|nr:hypothetical protein [Campylobacterota bacterium]